jgi:hypothetical protein
MSGNFPSQVAKPAATPALAGEKTVATTKAVPLAGPSLQVALLRRVNQLVGACASLHTTDRFDR